MKQLLQSLSSGDTTLADVPVPRASSRTIVVETRATVVSAGTERMLVEFGRSGLIEKARRQPERVRQVLDKMRTDGVVATLGAVRAKLEQPIALGYCNAGVVVDAGSGTPFAAGDRVVTNGPHADYVRVAHTLAARIPDGVSFEHAAFAPVAAIGLEGIRLAAPTLGETVVVYGLGLIGLLTVQLLRANGCRVIGIDTNDARLALGERFGAVVLRGGDGDAATRVMALTGGAGADAVLLTLSSSSDDPVHDAAAMARQRGRLVLVGVTGLALRRDDFYRKELTFAVSCSYGPGRYDPSYEEGGNDYPIGHVRWTEQRNFDAVLALMADGRLDPAPLITHRFDFAKAPEAYELITGDEPSLGVVLTYEDKGGVVSDTERVVSRKPRAANRESSRESRVASRGVAPVVGVIGAGNFAVRTLLPLLRESGATLRTIASSGGVNGAIAGEKFGFERVASDAGAVFEDPGVNVVFVLTRHDTHAALALRALRAGKHVFVEKPLALTDDDVDAIAAEARRTGRMVMVGFNRRFAPLARALGRETATRGGPLCTVITVNAGALPAGHWAGDAEQGGGRIVGEACHFIDLARALTGAPIVSLDVTSARDRSGTALGDVALLTLAFADGSVAAIHYLSSGSRAFPKERIECFFDGRTVSIDNWRRLHRWGAGSALASPFARAQDKGHAAEITAWMQAVRNGGPEPIPLEEVAEVSRWAIRAQWWSREPRAASRER